MPVLAQVGDDWHRGAARIAHEHLMSSTMRNILGSFLRLYARPEVSTRLLFATLAGERHEIGTLGAAMLAASCGLGVAYLGPDLPAREIVESVRPAGAHVLVLGLTTTSAAKVTERELRTIVRDLPKEVELWAGGRGAVRHTSIISPRGWSSATTTHTNRNSPASADGSRDVHITPPSVVIGVLVMAMATLRAGRVQEPLRVGDRMPKLKGQILTGRDAALPQASAGKVTLVAMGFTYKSRVPVEAWADWYRKTIGSRADVTFFEVPMIGGMATLGRWFINRGMRSGTPVDLHDRVITVYGGTGEWKRRLSYSPEHEDDAYLIVVDGEGVVRWLHHGGFDQAQADELKGFSPPSPADIKQRLILPPRIGDMSRETQKPAAPGAHSCSSRARPATSGDGWCPSSKARASGFAVLPGTRPRSRRASRRRRKWSRGSPRPGVARSRPRGSRRGLLPRALHGRTRRLPRNGSRSRPQFGEAARRAGVRRIVYLGGLATGDEALSKHLRSRIETGQVLRASGVPVVEFRASVVIGSGSLSFELIRALVERLPVMICPRWVSTLAQPIGIDDVLAYLAAALDLPDGDSRTFEIGGADQASYGDVMREYAGREG